MAHACDSEESGGHAGERSFFWLFKHSMPILMQCTHTQESRTHLALRRRRAGQFTVRCDRVGLLGEQPRPTRSELAEGGGHACEHGVVDGVEHDVQVSDVITRKAS